MKVKTEYPAADELIVAGPVGCTDVVANDDYRQLDSRTSARDCAP